MGAELQPVRVPLGDDCEGRLVFVDGALVGLLVCLSEVHGEQAGSWFLEAAFGDLAGPNLPVFPDLDTAQAWVLQRFNPLRLPAADRP
jgi:hypothetical protein